MTNRHPWPLITIEEARAPHEGAIAIGPFGSRMKSDTYVPAGVPVIRGNNIGPGSGLVNDFVFVAPEFAKTLGNANVYGGDLVFPHRGNIGTVGLVSEGHYVLSTSLMKLSVDQERFDPRFVFYFFRSTQGRYELLKNSSQVGTPGIATPLSSLRAIRIPCPPLTDQQVIADILGSLDDKIELNRRMNQTLEAMARAIFKSWFIDFAPVRAKAAGRTPPGLDPATAALFPDAFQDSPLGPIPQKWDIAKLADVCEINSRSVRKGDIQGEIEYVDIAAVSKGELSEVTKVDYAEAPSRARRRVQHGDTIWSCVRPNRQSYMFVHTPPANRIVSTGFVVLSPSKVGPCFLYEATTRPNFVDYLTANADGSAYPAVRPDHFAAAVIVVPEAKVLEAFESHVKPMRDRIEVNHDEARIFAAIRDTLLPKLLSGDLRVEQAEKAVEEVA